MLFWDAVITVQMAFRLVPEVLDPVDMIPVFDEPFRVIDPNVKKIGDIKGIVGCEAVGVDDAVGSYLAVDDR